MSYPELCQLPIGVFDSGVGGLTVLKALEEVLPHEYFLYLGDTARLPYGIKTPKTVSAYAIQATQFLLNQGIKLLVIACNTATALALPVLQQQFPELLMLGVIAPGARAAIKASTTNQIAVLATEATVNSRGYDQAILSLQPGAKVLALPANLLVSLAEEGLFTHEIPKLIIEHYLMPILKQTELELDTLILGCTHFPVLQPAIETVIAGRMQVINSAHAVALEVQALLAQRPELMYPGTQTPRTQFLVTDGVGRFMKVARIFLQRELEPQDVSLTELNFPV